MVCGLWEGQDLRVSGGRCLLELDESQGWKRAVGRTRVCVRIAVIGEVKVFGELVGVPEIRDVGSSVGFREVRNVWGTGRDERG